MEKIKYDSSSIQLISMFERMTSAKLKDAFEVDNLQVFVVQPGFIGKAVGKKGINVKKLAEMLKKNIKIIDYNPKIEVFAKNVTFPIIPARIEYDQKEKILTLIPKDMLSRGLLIGKQAVKLRETEKIIKRFFDVEEVKVSKPDGYIDETLKEEKHNPAQQPIEKETKEEATERKIEETTEKEEKEIEEETETNKTEKLNKKLKELEKEIKEETEETNILKEKKEEEKELEKELEEETELVENSSEETNKKEDTEEEKAEQKNR